jgi:hypothetical protein
VERVITKSFVGIIFLMLTSIYYAEWSLVMHVNLQATGFFDAIEYGTGDYQEDHSALAALLCTMPKEMQASLVCKETTGEAWEAIWTVRLGGERIKEPTVDKLYRDFYDLQFKTGECIEDFA